MEDTIIQTMILSLCVLIGLSLCLFTTNIYLFLKSKLSHQTFWVFLVDLFLASTEGMVYFSLI